MAKNKTKSVDCISCKEKESVPMIIIIPDDLTNGFEVEFKRCKECGHLMSNTQIESYFKELPKL